MQLSPSPVNVFWFLIWCLVRNRRKNMFLPLFKPTKTAQNIIFAVALSLPVPINKNQEYWTRHPSTFKFYSRAQTCNNRVFASFSIHWYKLHIVYCQTKFSRTQAFSLFENFLKTRKVVEKNIASDYNFIVMT